MHHRLPRHRDINRLVNVLHLRRTRVSLSSLDHRKLAFHLHGNIDDPAAVLVCGIFTDLWTSESRAPVVARQQALSPPHRRTVHEASRESSGFLRTVGARLCLVTARVVSTQTALLGNLFDAAQVGFNRVFGLDRMMVPEHPSKGIRSEWARSTSCAACH